MNIGEASKQSGLPPKTIRYYEDRGLIAPPARAENGYRDYNDTDVPQATLRAPQSRTWFLSRRMFTTIVFV